MSLNLKEIFHMRQIQVAASKIRARMFRNNTGVGWAGKVQIIKFDQLAQLHPGDVIVRNARPLHAGIADGGSDLIGWKIIRITPAHVGRDIAQFMACEVKSETGKCTDQQLLFLHAVRQAGGCAIEARSVDDFLTGASDE